jgi:mRNA-degrading endonuclease RelE of RelBE toxin-antitoxin system
MKHFASPAFWDAFEKLPEEVRDLAEKNYELLKQNPQHPSLRLKKVGKYWSARIGRGYRALAVDVDACCGSGSALTPITTSWLANAGNGACR